MRHGPQFFDGFPLYGILAFLSPWISAVGMIEAQKYEVRAGKGALVMLLDQIQAFSQVSVLNISVISAVREYKMDTRRLVDAA